MRKIVVLVAALAIIGLAGWRFYFADRPRDPNLFQGYVEGDSLLIAPVEGERLDKLFVDVGRQASAGQPIFVMATDLLESQRREQAARMDQAEAQLANLRAAQQRPEQIAVLQAAVDRANAQLTLSRNELGRQQVLFPRGASTKVALDQANAAFERDRASLEEARRQIEAAKLGGRVQEIGAAEAAVLAARAQLRQIETRIARQTVNAPASGLVQDVFFRPGETVNAGQPVLSILPPGNRKVRFFAPEPMLARLQADAPVAVSCDNCPPDLTARISYIAQQTEFTPPVIFSEQERAKLVYKIEARFDDKGARLPLGLPVSVRLMDSK
ncbi:MAG: HlyD family efflux transporter periplasmic adaptor subunit [Hyphomicrobiales bacterium]|nr:HlyD family efflux transporter periplasmic adaptor subunit [Hyphomicrobiales bacterium]